MKSRKIKQRITEYIWFVLRFARNFRYAQNVKWNRGNGRGQIKMTKVKKWKEWVETQMKEWGCKIEVVPVINLFGIISLSLTRGRLDKNPENWSEDDKKKD